MDALSALKMVGAPDLANLRMVDGTDLASQLTKAGHGSGTNLNTASALL